MSNSGHKINALPVSNQKQDTKGRPKGKKRPSPLSIRLSSEERKLLAARAGGTSLSAYVKDVLFSADVTSSNKSRGNGSVERALIARLLAYLGAGQLTSSLSDLAKAANTGNLYFDDHTRLRLLNACSDLRAMRFLLLHALGKKVPQESLEEGVLEDEFASRAFSSGELELPLHAEARGD